MKRLSQLFIVLVLVLSLSGCTAQELNVVVTSYPVEFLVKRIAGDSVQIRNLSEGSIPQQAVIREDYEAVLKEADVLFYINEQEPYLELYMDDIKEMKVKSVDLSELSSLYPFQRYTTVYSAGSSALIEEAYYDGKLFDEVDIYEYDPILWMDPVAMTSMARTIKDYLVEESPDNAGMYRSNFDELEVDLTRLQTDYQALRDSEVSLSFVSVTPSFGNWQKSFNLGVYPLIISKYGVLPDEDMLVVIREKIMNDGVQYIAKEDNLPEEYEALYNQIKTELDLEEVKLKNLFVLSENDRQEKFDYVDIMYQNLGTLEAMILD